MEPDLKEAKLKSTRDWYRRHSETFNEQRKKKYAESPDYRAKAAARAKRLREDPNHVNEGRQVRVVHNGVEIDAYSTAYVAKELGVSAQTIRLWEKSGKIPAPTIQSKQRLYRLHQVERLKAFCDALTNNPEIEQQIIHDLNYGWG